MIWCSTSSHGSLEVAHTSRTERTASNNRQEEGTAEQVVQVLEQVVLMLLEEINYLFAAFFFHLGKIVFYTVSVCNVNNL